MRGGRGRPPNCLIPAARLTRIGVVQRGGGGGIRRSVTIETKLLGGTSRRQDVALTFIFAVATVDVDGSNVFSHAFQLSCHRVGYRRGLRHVSVCNW